MDTKQVSEHTKNPFLTIILLVQSARANSEMHCQYYLLCVLYFIITVFSLFLFFDDIFLFVSSFFAFLFYFLSHLFFFFFYFSHLDVSLYMCIYVCFRLCICVRQGREKSYFFYILANNIFDLIGVHPLPSLAVSRVSEYSACVDGRYTWLLQDTPRQVNVARLARTHAHEYAQMARPW